MAANNTKGRNGMPRPLENFFKQKIYNKLHPFASTRFITFIIGKFNPG